MARRLTRSGETYIVENARRMRQAERLACRDRDLYRKQLQGLTAPELARYFKMSERQIYRRLAAIPAFVREALAEERRRIREINAEIVGERMERRLAHAR